MGLDLFFGLAACVMNVRLKLLLCAATLYTPLSGCCWGEDPMVSAVDIPTTLEDAQALADPPEVLVETERKTRRAGGGGCGHSVACVILLPILAYDALFPKKYDEVSVRVGGELSFQGQYSTKGELISAASWREGRVHRYDVLKLERLGKRVVIESGSAPVKAGEAGIFERRSILEQVDLLADYRAAIAKRSPKSPLVVEALSWLGMESRPLVNEYVSDASMRDKGRADVLSAACKSVSRPCLSSPSGRCPEPFWGDMPGLLDRAARSPGADLSLAALECAETADHPKRQRFVDALVSDICAEGSASRAKLTDLRRYTRGEGGGSVALGACKKALRKIAIGAAMGEPTTSARLAKVLGSSDTIRLQLAQTLDASRKGHRRALFAGLAKHPLDEVYLERLSAAQILLESDEIDILAPSLVRKSSFLRGCRGLAYAISLLHEAPDGPAKRRAVETLEAALKRSPKSIELLSGLVALGVTSHARPMLDQAQYLSRADMKASHCSSDEDLVTIVLALRGCSSKEYRGARDVALGRGGQLPGCLVQ